MTTVRWLRRSTTPLPTTWLLATLTVASHGLLDSMTTGGLGAALLWPFDLTRYFAPIRPIPVAPILVHFLSLRGLYCSAVEVLLLSPCWVWALWPWRPWARPASRAG